MLFFLAAYNKWEGGKWGSEEEPSEIQKKIMEMTQQMEKKGATEEEFLEKLREMNEMSDEENDQKGYFTVFF